MSLEWDFSKDWTRALASLDQRLQPFKEYYMSLDDEKRAGFRRWVMQISQPFADDLEGWAAMMSDIGCTGEAVVGAHIKVTFLREGQTQETAEVEPQHLRQAIKAWEEGKDFAPPLGYDM